MSKSLKDIVEEGFTRLSALSEKRKELLARCDELSNSDSSRQSQHGLQKLEATENAYSSEITVHVERSQEVLQQTLSQIVEDNERFLSSVKENLQLRIARVLKELSYTREWLLAGSSEKFDSSIRPLEREMEAGTTDLRFEALKILGELEACCKRSQSSLHEAQAEIAGRLSSSEHELTGSLGSEFGSLVQESERRRHQVTESLEKLYSEQASQMTSLTEEMDERISSVVTQHLQTVKDLGKSAEESLQQTRQRVVSSAASEIVALSQESFSELEASYEFSHQELSDKLSDLRVQTDQLLQQVTEFLSELETGTKTSADSLAEELKNRPNAAAAGALSARNPVDDTIRQLARELDASASDFTRQLNDLLKVQADRLSNLCSGFESSISTSATALNTELKQMTRLHEQTWSEREQELLLRLRRMEKEAQETYAAVSNDSIDNNADASADGSV